MEQTTPTPAAAEKAVKPAKLEQNGIIRPSADSQTGKVWSIADSISAANKAPAERKEVLAEAIKQGINDATAATQYGKWRKFFGIAVQKKIKQTPEEIAAEKAAKKAEKVAAAAAEKATKDAKKAADKAAKDAEKKAKADAAAAAKAAEKPAELANA